MSAITLIVFGLIGFWVYYSVKHEGIYWIPRTGAAIGGFVLYLWMMFKIFREVQPTWFAVFLVISSIIVLTKIADKIVFWADNKIEERVGKDPYKQKDKLTSEQEQYMKDLREELIRKNNLDPDE
tara:strand:- start:226 stop:600 length:375 start_codon:yes stop_codon:yes gene_type:complete